MASRRPSLIDARWGPVRDQSRDLTGQCRVGCLSVDGGHAGGQTGGPQEPSLEALVFAVPGAAAARPLPVSKTGCVRSHSCICKPGHVCSGRLPAVVPVLRGAQDGSVAAPMEKQKSGSQSTFSSRGHPNHRLSDVAGLTRLRPSVCTMRRRRIGRFPVAGAQLLARSFVALPTIQMIGRWGSLAVNAVRATGDSDSA